MFLIFREFREEDNLMNVIKTYENKLKNETIIDFWCAL